MNATKRRPGAADSLRSPLFAGATQTARALYIAEQAGRSSDVAKAVPCQSQAVANRGRSRGEAASITAENGKSGARVSSPGIRAV
jgi:hypothetical protein